MSQIMSQATPVVMLRSGHHGGLDIARSLGRLGVPVYSVDAARWEAAFSSRYCRGRFVLDIEGEMADRAVAALEQGASNSQAARLASPQDRPNCSTSNPRRW